MTEITAEADREAAAAIVYMENKSGLNWASAEGMRDQVAEGRWDWHPAVQVFASHRKAAMDYWYRQGKDDGAEHERAKIVSYARGHGGNAWSRDVLYFADKIEAKEHLK